MAVSAWFVKESFQISFVNQIKLIIENATKLLISIKLQTDYHNISNECAKES